ncbi:MAG: phosphoribosylanthranilate isomerase, partial [Victivallales bacterium]|nr:phosphoribosylanthranilate isomerase [Victivallales bacterium]
MNSKLKICGLSRREDIEAAIEAGAKYLGFIFYDKSPRCVSPEQVRDISRDLPEDVKKVGVFVNASIEDFQRIVKLCKLDVVQLHGDESPEFALRLKGIEVWKALRLRNADDMKYAENYPADAVLVDAMTAEQRGGTGQLCDWSLAAELSSMRPVILAGGISPENIKEAIGQVKPVIIDVNSGVES